MQNNFFLKYSIYALIVIVLVSCKSADAENVVAEAYGQKLTETEVQYIVPENSTTEDSLIIAQDVISSWLKEKVLIHHAEEHLLEEQKDFEELIENYRNSLIVYAFEQKIIQEKLDTHVFESEIEAYYKENEQNLLLKDFVIKVLYLKIDPESPEIENVKNWMADESSEARLKLEEYSHQYALSYFMNDDQWIYLDDFFRDIPIQIKDKVKFLKINKFLEFENDSNLYLINISDYKIKGAISPFEVERNNIKNQIINKRKMNLLSNMKEELFEKAIASHQISIKSK